MLEIYSRKRRRMLRVSYLLMRSMRSEEDAEVVLEADMMKESRL